LKSGEEVVTDPELTVQYIYSLYFWVGNVGALWVFITIYLEKQCGFAEAYGLGLGFIIIAVLMLIFLKSRVSTFAAASLVEYPLILPDRKAHTDSVMIPAVKILTCAVRNGFKMERADPDYQYMHHKKEVSWDSGFVHELKGGLGACRVL
jgi:POT family proton-dependent oligopeptide transporter